MNRNGQFKQTTNSNENQNDEVERLGSEREEYRKIVWQYKKSKSIVVNDKTANTTRHHDEVRKDNINKNLLVKTWKENNSKMKNEDP